MRSVFRQGLQVAGLAGLGTLFCLAATPHGWFYGSLAIAGVFFLLALVRLGLLLKRHGSENLQQAMSRRVTWCLIGSVAITFTGFLPWLIWGFVENGSQWAWARLLLRGAAFV